MFDFEFPPDDQVKDDRPTVPPGTEAWLKVRTDDDGQIKINSGTSERTSKPWISVPLIVDGGEFDGRWCSLMMTPDPNNRYFRHDFQVITGVDVSTGAKADGQVFEEKLRSGRFFATIESRGDFVNVKKMLRREELEVGPSPTIGEAPAAAVSDDDIPF